jgi:hypothetical protein
MRFLRRLLMCLILALGLLFALSTLPPLGSYAQAATLTPHDDGLTDSHSYIVYHGAWSSYAKAEAYDGSYARSNASDASVTIRFKGTEFHWIATAGTTTGLADVYVDGTPADGGPSATVNLNRTSAQYQADVWHATFTNGLHSVTIVPNAYNAGSKYITVDEVQIVGTLVPAPPTITSISPSYGPTSGGTSVVINGTNLQPTIDYSITFGGIPARSYVMNSSTQVTAISPAHASGTVPVVVTTSAAATPVSDACDFTYSDSAPPTLNHYEDTALSYSFYTGGWSTLSTTSASADGYRRCSDSASSVTIPFEGTEFHWIATRGKTMGQADVFVDGSSAKAATIDLHRNSATYQNDVWSVTLPQGYHTVTITRATSSPAGSYINLDRVDIMGTIPSTKRIDAPFGWPFIQTGWSNAGSQSAWGGSYWMTNTGGGSITLPFSGMRYSLMATTGGSWGELRVTVDSQPSFLVDLYGLGARYQQTVYTSPFLAPGNHVLKLEWSGEKNASAGDTTVNIDAVDILGVYDLPIITQVSPANGPEAGGNKVVLTGYTFTDSPTVYFGATAASDVTVDSENQITATAPPGSGTVKVTVENMYGWSLPDAAARYRYIGEAHPPSISGLSPTSGPAEGGTNVTIGGADFTEVTSVTFGGEEATNVEANDAGTQITCSTPAHTQGVVDVTVTTAAGLDTAAGAFAYAAVPLVTRYDQTDIHIVKSGTWTDYASTSAYNGSYGRASTALASATIYFTGTQLDWIATKGTTTGKADVYVDGVKVTATPIDLTASAATYKVNVFSTGALSSGSHIVKIERSAASASGKYLTLDAVDIYGTIADPPVTKTRYEQTNTQITKVGTWTNYSSTASSGASYGRSSTVGATPASATIKFVGTRLDYIAMKGTTTGYAEIWVDGVNVTGTTPINLYASPAAYQQTIYSTSTLPFGLHTVKIVRASASGSGTYLTVDAFDVWGWITN